MDLCRVDYASFDGILTIGFKKGMPGLPLLFSPLHDRATRGEPCGCLHKVRCRNFETELSLVYDYKCYFLAFLSAAPNPSKLLLFVFV